MEKAEAVKKVQEACEFVFGVDPSELKMDKTLYENGMGQPEQLILMLKLEAEFNVECDDKYFNQLEDANNPILYGNRPVNELVDYFYDLANNNG
jgi:acyl carrier protein